MSKRFAIRPTAIAGALLVCATGALADPLPSWNDTDAKSRILAFVDTVTDPQSSDYVTPDARIATFDNDGTLWAEQPVYFQLFYAVEQVAEMAKTDPSILTTDARKAAANGDLKAVLTSGKEDLIDILALSHTGRSVEEFQADVAAWLDTSRHPKTGLRYDQMVYQPMLELLTFLRDQDFDTYIVSGGGIHFMRVFAEDVYGIPPEHVIGSSIVTTYDTSGATPTIQKQPELFFNDDKEGKPLAIDRHIGRRPIMAGGNSDGDFQMLEWSTSGDGARLGLYVHHTDADREWAYDREGHIGVLNRGLDEAEQRGWLVIDMANDWSTVFPTPAK
ncbi:HAD family hydrolase [Shimia sp.]|uniref:HAD family hydrolase n=1 Tax=Shimia sp. TaxID=1954381 RepID=UPI0032972A82